MDEPKIQAVAKCWRCKCWIDPDHDFCFECEEAINTAHRIFDMKVKAGLETVRVH
jgi:hypothetical protein